MEQETLHFDAVETILFASSGARMPPWLLRQADECVRRYGGFRLIPEFKAALNAFSNDTPKPFELFVIGEGKFGKSTLVNAMLGEARSKSRGLPETRCFLRYVITDRPTNSCRIFLRLVRGTHDWIRTTVGQGRAVPDLFEIYEYHVDGAVAARILREEASRLDAGNYPPAVFEVERDHARTNRCMFPAGVRIVDTQGLDQLFPDDLQQLGRNAESASITQRFLDWMSSTPRGKHLEWQFRRCDSVLWCVNAKRIGSAATDASMTYFSSYAKKIVVALTNVDLVAKNEAARARLMAKAHQKYGRFARVILSVNGQMALESALAGDMEGIRESGLASLAASLTNICVSEGAKTRAISRYLGLRRTETQFRSALGRLEGELSDLRLKYQADMERTSREVQRVSTDFGLWLNDKIEGHTREVIARIQQIDLSDDRNACLAKLGVSALTASMQNLVDGYFHKTIASSVIDVAGHIDPYRLPLFDSEGERCGDLCAISVEISRPSIPSLTLWLQVTLQDEVFIRAALWVKEKVLGFFSEQARVNAVNEERRLIAERQEYVLDAFLAEWGQCIEKWTELLLEQLCKMYAPIFDEIEKIKSRVESFENEPLNTTATRINRALKVRGANSALQERFVSMCRSGRGIT